MGAVAIAELEKTGGIGANEWRAQLMAAADAAGNRDGKIDCAELDAYLRNPKDAKFQVPGAPKNPALKTPRLTDEGLAALRSRIAEKTGEVDELRIVPRRGQPGVALLRTYSRSVYDNDKRIPAIVGYVLSSADVTEEHAERSGNFREDPLVAQSASPSDYDATPDDVGHMRPAKDSPNAEAMYESFYYSNAVPQNSQLNRGAWKSLENAIRKIVLDSGGRAVIFTGSLFLDAKDRPLKKAPVMVNGRVAEPTHIFKAVMLTTPDNHVTMFGFVVPNQARGAHRNQIKQLLAESRRSIADIQRLSGFDIFSDVPAEVQKPMKESTDACPLLPPKTAVHAASLLFPADCTHHNWTLPNAPGSPAIAAQPGFIRRFGNWLWSLI